MPSICLDLSSVTVPSGKPGSGTCGGRDRQEAALEGEQCEANVCRRAHPHRRRLRQSPASERAP